MGNNDTKYHYQPASIESEEWAPSFYQYTFDNFFVEHPANKDFAAEVEQTWMQGGYYRLQVAENLHVISVNTLPYNSNDETDDTDLKVEQLAWLKE